MNSDELVKEKSTPPTSIGIELLDVELVDRIVGQVGSLVTHRPAELSSGPAGPGFTSPAVRSTLRMPAAKPRSRNTDQTPRATSRTAVEPPPNRRAERRPRRRNPRRAASPGRTPGFVGCGSARRPHIAAPRGVRQAAGRDRATASTASASRPAGQVRLAVPVAHSSLRADRETGSSGLAPTKAARTIVSGPKQCQG